MDFHEQELNRELEWMREQFSPFGGELKRPKSLDAQALFDRLDDLDSFADDKQAGQVVRLKKPMWLRSAASIAACFAVVAGAIMLRHSTGSTGMLRSGNNMEINNAKISPMMDEAGLFSAQSSVLAGDVGQAADYTQIRDAVNQMNTAWDAQYGGPWEVMEDAVEPDSAPPEMAADFENPATAGGGDTGGGFSSTNVQESGVDEADIVKTDGRYIYSFVSHNTTNSSPAIFITDSTTMTVTSKIVLESSSINEFYLSGEQLVVVGYDSYQSIMPLLPKTTIVEQTNADLVQTQEIVDSGMAYHDSFNQTVYSVVYDISNREKPVKLQEFTQDGYYHSSRMIDGTLYLVSERSISPDLRNKMEPLYRLIPFTYDGNKARFVSADEIVIAPQGYYPTYSVVSAVDVKTGKSSTRAVLGGSVEGIYMSQDNCYVYYSSAPAYELADGDAYRTTGIIRFSADGTNISYSGTTNVDGWLDGQFSLSEKDGKLRVVTTADYLGKERSNSLFVFDENLNQIGQLTGLAPNEQVYSVRYVGDMAYVVTFRQVDPLFAIDLSDPENPKLLGQLKIPGFSEYLHPLDEHTLLGIGQNANMDGQLQGLKLSLFDVSDPTDPKETGIYNFGHAGSYSEALYNHKSVMFHDGKQIFAFPAALTARDYENAQDFYMLFTYDKETGFTLLEAISGGDANEYLGYRAIQRGLYIGQTLYTFSADEIVSYDLDTLEVKDKVSLK